METDLRAGRLRQRSKLSVEVPNGPAQSGATSPRSSREGCAAENRSGSALVLALTACLRSRLEAGEQAFGGSA
jgi:hypothetical protein